MSHDVFSAKQFRCSKAPTAEWSPASTDMPDSPIRPFACLWQHCRLLRSRPTECQQEWWWCIFWLPCFFLLSTRLYTFSLCQCQRSICPLPTQTVAPAERHGDPSEPWTPHAPLLLLHPSAVNTPQSRDCIYVWTRKHTNTHTYATELMSGKPQQLQSHSHNESVTKLYPPIPRESRDFNIWHFCTLTHVRQHLLPGCEICLSTASVWGVCACFGKYKCGFVWMWVVAYVHMVYTVAACQYILTAFKASFVPKDF